MFFSFQGVKPVLGKDSFVHPSASIIGDVIIGDRVFVGAGAVIRGDFGRIVIEDGCNVQENCVIHMFPGITVTMHRNAHIGHGAVIHGATIGENCLVGMNAVIMDEVQIGKESIVGAQSFVPAGMNVPARSLLVGNPAKIIKQVSDKMLEWKTSGTELYQELSKQCIETLLPCDPLNEPEPNRPVFSANYSTWSEKKSS